MHEQAGVTRDRKEVEADWNGRSFLLVDTGGVDIDEDDDLASARCSARRARRWARPPWRCSWWTPRAGLRPGDAELAAELRGVRVPVVVAANKVDSALQAGRAAEFYALGLGDPVPVSAATGSAPATCSTAWSSGWPTCPSRRPSEATRLAVIGRPNVGKSSLVNKLLGEERVIVADLAGTTRDAIDTRIEVDGRPVAGGHRRAAPPHEGGGHRRLLRPAALRARRRARRRGDRALRRHRGHHHRGPPHRRPGDAHRLRHGHRAQQVGRDRHRPRGRPRAGEPEAAPAPAADGGLGQDRARAHAAGGRGARRWPTAPPSGPHPAAQPLPGRRPGRAPAPGHPRAAAADVLHGPVRDLAAALRDPGERPHR